MITDKVVNIAVIQLAVINDFRLVLLVCSTKECPKLIFGRLILLFWAMIRTLQTQKERAQRSFSSDSYYFLLLKKIYNKSPHERADEHMLSLLVNDIYNVILVQNYNITVQSICTA